MTDYQLQQIAEAMCAADGKHPHAVDHVSLDETVGYVENWRLYLPEARRFVAALKAYVLIA